MKNKSPIAVALFLVLFFAVGFVILGIGIHGYLQSNMPKAWPTTEGTIESCEMVETDDPDGPCLYRAAVSYSYTVADKRHHGDRIAFGYTASSSMKVHQEIVDKLSSARAVLVQYDPANPKQSVLSYGIHQSIFLELVFGAMWILFVSGYTVLVVNGALSDSGILKTLVTTR